MKTPPADAPEARTPPCHPGDALPPRPGAGQEATVPYGDSAWEAGVERGEEMVEDEGASASEAAEESEPEAT